MEINKELLTALLSYDDETLKGKLLEIADVAGLGRAEAQKLLSDMPRVRAMLSMISDDDVRGFLTRLKR